MTFSEEEILPGLTVEQFEENAEGQDYSYMGEDDNKRHILCDFCSKGVPFSSEPRVAGYFADQVLNKFHPLLDFIEQEETLIPLATYCEDCSQDLLFYPCKGFAEIRVRFDLDEDKKYKNLEVTDVSSRNDGIPYDPDELTERVTQTPVEANELMDEDQHLWGPENRITFFLSVTKDVDIRDVINYDGSIDPKALGRARKEWENHAQEYLNSGMDRRTFRDRATDDK